MCALCALRAVDKSSVESIITSIRHSGSYTSSSGGGGVICGSSAVVDLPALINKETTRSGTPYSNRPSFPLVRLGGDRIVVVYVALEAYSRR